MNINHCNRVVAVINVQDFAGNGFAERRQQSQSGTADLFLRNVCLQRCVQFVPAQNLAEIADAGSGQRFNRAGGNRIDADFLLSHINRGITYRSFQRSFGNAHNIVVRQNTFGPEIGQGNDGAVFVHIRRSAAAGFQKRVAGNVHRVGEVFQRRVNGAAFKLVLVRKGNRMNHKVNLAPFFAQFLKAGFDRS